MYSFIELPRLGFRGLDQPSIYVNTRDILTVQQEYDGQVVIEIRGYGADALIGRIRTYVPLVALLDVLGLLAEDPGVRSWSLESKTEWAAPIVQTLQEAAERERASAAR